MIISGIQKTSLIDYPRKICTVLFTQGCNFSCGFCHNPELVKPKLFTPPINLSDILTHLKKRKGKIDAVTITGGEPTIHKDLPKFIKTIKDLGYLIKLDTNGTNPTMLQHLIDHKLLNYVAMDIKNSPHKYKKTSNSNIIFQNIKKSTKMIMRSNISYEFRTTVIPTTHTQKDFEAIGHWLSGAKKYYLQNFRPTKTLNPSFQSIKPYTKKELTVFRDILKKTIKNVFIR